MKPKYKLTWWKPLDSGDDEEETGEYLTCATNLADAKIQLLDMLEYNENPISFFIKMGEEWIKIEE